MRRSLSQRLGGLTREIAVIVAGVTLALGADAVYDRASDRAERGRIVRSLEADLQVDSGAYARALEGSLAVASDATAALLALVEDPGQSASELELGSLVRESILFPSGQKESATYREIIATGSIALIADPELREAMLSYYSRSFTGLSSELWSHYVSEVHGAYERSLRAHMGAAYVALAACIPSGPPAAYEACLEQPSSRLDLAALRADKDFLERLVGMTLWARRFRVYVGEQAAGNRELAALVGKAVVGP